MLAKSFVKNKTIEKAAGNRRFCADGRNFYESCQKNKCGYYVGGSR